MVRSRKLTDVGRVLDAAEAASPVDAVRGRRALTAAGHALQDDATVLCLDWLGAHESRDSVSGASPALASDPLG